MPRTSDIREVSLPDGVDQYLEQVGDQLLAGRTELWRIPPGVLSLWTYAQTVARQPLLEQIARLNAECDRLYVEVARRTPPTAPEHVPFAELQRRRTEMYGGGR
ncbi:hypothetical protein DEI93_03235 [Curtobacterium sp. MCBD17_035]|uniref:hypothetical protein n=1 Tax=Curtobacterium sp. MCBD17_035 TaxID=2175673 RepID=UPI0011B4F2C8|nr:hypothetical protein [Curtobacterium sp. MCBD17_035]WIB68071.1 hypothetical protein DEI93_03235 [Curtobacterium sp. MCBD17_035]